MYESCDSDPVRWCAVVRCLSSLRVRLEAMSDVTEWREVIHVEAGGEDQRVLEDVACTHRE